MIREWKLQPRSRKSAACAHPFEEGDTCCSVLQPNPDEPSEIMRNDYCRACWKQRPPNGMLSSWKARILPVAPPPPLPLELDIAEALLDRWSPPQTEAAAHGCLILTALLERKKILIARSSFEEDGKAFTVYEHRRSGRTFAIEQKHLALEDLEKIQAQVMDLLNRAAEDEDLILQAEAPDAEQ